MKLLIVGVPLLLFIVGISFRNWRYSVKAALVLVVIEGALRKWFLPQASDLIYFLKDFVLLGAYIRYYGFSSSERKLIFMNNSLGILTFVASGWCLFQAFNVSLGSPIPGLFGLKSYIFYIPLLWMVPNLFQSERELYHFLRSYLAITIPIGILGIVQFFSPADSIINSYANSDVKSIATFGVSNFVRITGTFSYLGSYGVYLVVCFGLLVTLLTVKQSLIWRLTSIVGTLFVVTNSFMNGSRTVVFALAAFLIGYWGIKVLTLSSNNWRLLRQFLLTAIVVGVVASIWFKPAIETFTLRTTQNKDAAGRFIETFQQPFDFIQYKALDGYGTGATHPGSQALRKALNLPSGESVPLVYEPEPGRVMLELGPIGFFFWYALRLSLIVYLWIVFCKLKKPWLKELALAVFLIQVIQFYNLLVFNQVFSIYYWFLSGFIFLLPRLEQIENWQREQQLLQEDALSPYFSDSPYR